MSKENRICLVCKMVTVISRLALPSLALIRYSALSKCFHHHLNSQPQQKNRDSFVEIETSTTRTILRITKKVPLRPIVHLRNSPLYGIAKLTFSSLAAQTSDNGHYFDVDNTTIITTNPRKKIRLFKEAWFSGKYALNRHFIDLTCFIILL